MQCEIIFKQFMLWVASLIVVANSLHAQNSYATWVFGNGYELRWKQNGQIARDPVLTISSPLASAEGTACLSDTCSGNLLFQSDGLQIWNGEGVLVSGSQGLCSGVSSRQNCVFVPWKGHPDRVFLFAAISLGPTGSGIDPIPQGSDCTGSYTYSLVTKQPNGTFTVTLKNVALSPTRTTAGSEIIAATANRTGDGYWVLTYDPIVGEILAYLVDFTGVHPEPVISAAPGGSPIGSIQISPDGSKVALASQVVSVFDFNNATGKLSRRADLWNFDPYSTFNKKYFANFHVTFCNAANFSPNSQLLYITQLAARQVNGKDEILNRVLQFDLSEANEQRIANSIEVIYETSDISKLCQSELTPPLNLGVDGRLWLNMQSWLDCIEFPNRRGPECGYRENVLQVPQSSRFSGLTGFPTIINSDVIVKNTGSDCRPPWSSIVGDTVCLGACAVVRTQSQNIARSWNWYAPGSSQEKFIGNDSAVICYDKPGTYFVFVTVGNEYGSEEVTAKVVVKSRPLAKLTLDTFPCNNGPTTACVTGSDRYVWVAPKEIRGMVTPTVQFTVADSVNVTVVATTKEGCSDTVSAIVRRQNLNVQVFGDTTVCEGSVVRLTANGASYYSWAGLPADALVDKGSVAFVAHTSMEVLVVGTDSKYNCNDTVYHRITVRLNPKVRASSDTTICALEPLQLRVNGAISYRWTPEVYLDDPNSSSPVAHVSTTTKFVVHGIDSNGCSSSDTVWVNVTVPGNVTLPSDTTICQGEMLGLLAESTSPSIEWIDIQTGQSVGVGRQIKLSPLRNTTLVARDVSNFCSTSDTISITVRPFVVVEATNDTAICEGRSVQLVSSAGESTIWSDIDGSILGHGAYLTVQPNASQRFIASTLCGQPDTVLIRLLPPGTVEARVGSTVVEVGHTFQIPLTVVDSQQGETRLQIHYDGRIMRVDSIAPGQVVNTVGAGRESCVTSVRLPELVNSMCTISGRTFLAPVVTTDVTIRSEFVDSCIVYRTMPGKLTVIGCALRERIVIGSSASGIVSSFSTGQRTLTITRIEADKSEAVLIELHSIIGAKALECVTSLAAGQSSIIIPLETIPNGLYAITIRGLREIWNDTVMVY